MRREKRGTGRRVRSREQAAPVASPVWPGMTGGRYLPLDPSELERIHQLALRLLADLGLSQITPSLESRAVAAGCYLDNNGRLHFPRTLVEDVIARS
ncbi:MAG: methyltransferase, partial [Gammaproteobacteria bacterium]|nr:methyltransferase [Gammaproteobacteria bacterium]